ncbi:hypothetical protein L7F22_064908 [Adiantum nelumboides]|nr:hypothetical protein [Adiantum nelumboides]
MNCCVNSPKDSLGSVAMKDSMLFGRQSGEGNPKEALGGSNDMLGELREEEIVWGEAELSQQHKEAGIGGSGEKTGMKITGGGRKHRAMGRQRSMLSRQLEMQASAWAGGDRMSEAARKSFRQGHEHKVESGSGDEEVGGTQLNMDKLIPPHELLAQQYAASASFSVLHGAGRTLKGMDLCRLRNEVWRQTGFVD